MSIWKTPDQKPEDGSEILFMIGENHCVGYYDKHSGLYVEPKRFYDTEYAPDEIDRWIYADDLIAQADKAERLQKGIDLLFRQASVWSWQTAPTPDKKIVLSRRQILGWLKKLKEIVKGE